MVIYNHSSALLNHSTADSFFLVCAVHLKQIIFTAVPLFVMLSGALLIGKKEEPSVFFAKRLNRILIPFIVWSSITFILLHFKQHIPLHPGSIGELGWLIFSGGTYGVYWYIYLIISLYLLTPFLRVIVQNMSLRMVTMLCILPLCWYYIGGYLPEVQLAFGWRFPWAIYLSYFIAGYILSRVFLSPGLIKKISPIYDKASIIVSILLIVVYTCVSYGERHWSEFPATLGIFILILHIPQTPAEKAAARLQFISKTSYGIYLSHFIIISGIMQTGVFDFCSIWAKGLCIAGTVLIMNTVLFYVLEKCRVAKWFM